MSAVDTHTIGESGSKKLLVCESRLGPYFRLVENETYVSDCDVRLGEERCLDWIARHLGYSDFYDMFDREDMNERKDLEFFVRKHCKGEEDL